MKRVWTKLAVGCVAATMGFGMAGLTHAADDKKGSNATADVKIKDEGSQVQQVRAAMETAAWGRANKNPAALAIAAKMLEGVSPKEIDKLQKEESGTAAAGDEKKTTKVTAETLMAEAKALAGDSKDAQAAIDAVTKAGVASRGAVGGAIARYGDVVKGNFINTYTVTFRGGELAEVGTWGDGSTNLDLFVYDENGNLIAQDTGPGDRCYVALTPKWTGVFKVRVINRGALWNAYNFYTN